MTDGVFAPSYARYKTKKALKEAVATSADPILESTSMFGGIGGPFSELPDGTYTVVGPDPYKSRKWYANIIIRGSKVTVK